MGFLDALFTKGDKSTVLHFELVDTDEEELARCRKREPLVFRCHPSDQSRVLVYHKLGQGVESKVGAVPAEKADTLADHLGRGFLCEGSILEITGGQCRVKCRMIGL
jgi:hypothetical protein